MNHHEPGQHEPGTHETKSESFMRAMGHLRGLYGPANRRTASEPERHGHNPEDVKEERELSGIDIETDSEGHRYGVRRAGADE
jgi:hypothetical protein